MLKTLKEERLVPVVPCGVPIWPLVLLQVVAGCPEGVLLEALRPLRLALTTQPRSPLRTAAVVPTLAMAHAAGARTGTGHGRSTCLSIALLAPAADCLVSSPHLSLPAWCRNLAGAALRQLAAHSQKYSPSARRLWPSLSYRFTACTIYCGKLKHSTRGSGDLLTFSLPPAAPLLSVLGSMFHLALICCAASSTSSFSLLVSSYQ